MTSSDPSRKRGREEVPLPLLAEPEEVPPAPPEEVPPPLPEEVKWLKPPRRKVPLPMRAPSVNAEDAYFSVNMLYQAWQSLKKMAIHLGVQRPPEPLQTTSMDYTFKVNFFAGHLEREVVPPPPRPAADDDDGSLDVSSSDSDSDSDGGAPPAATTSA
jgi:hypothetical protein